MEAEGHESALPCHGISSLLNTQHTTHNTTPNKGITVDPDHVPSHEQGPPGSVCVQLFGPSCQVGSFCVVLCAKKPAFAVLVRVRTAAATSPPPGDQRQALMDTPTSRRAARATTPGARRRRCSRMSPPHSMAIRCACLRRRFFCRARTQAALARATAGLRLAARV